MTFALGSSSWLELWSPRFEWLYGQKFSVRTHLDWSLPGSSPANLSLARCHQAPGVLVVASGGPITHCHRAHEMPSDMFGSCLQTWTPVLLIYRRFRQVKRSRDELLDHKIDGTPGLDPSLS